MGKSLVVVESPAKAKTINKILGKDFEVKSCMGHVRDLPPKELGIDIEHNFKPRYVTIRGKGKILTELRRAAQTADTIYLATDPDREGEAIAWHVSHAIARKEDDVQRIMFNEITPKAVRNSIQESRMLNLQKIDAQQARRVLDRLVGYEISPLLWKVIHSGLSAGRVQSVALRVICERDREIEAFEPEEYWSIEALVKQEKGQPFRTRLVRHLDEKIAIANQTRAEAIAADLNGAELRVKEVKKRNQLRHPAPPFTTSTLQQECARRMRFSVKRTDAVAQQLYEGVELEGEVRGLITYMRTDSVRVSDDALAEVRERIDRRYGAEYLPAEPNKYKTKSSAQDAHEAIRPTSADLEPGQLKDVLTRDQVRVYELIWNRFVASQMKPQILNITTINIEAGDYMLRSSGSSTQFPGFSLVYSESKEEEEEEEEEEETNDGPPPNIAQGEALLLQKLSPQQHFTKPPAHYSEAALVKELEAKGIGRPSTYASIITVIQDRQYVEKVNNRYLSATERGHTVNKLLVETFPHIFNVEFTAQLENELDRIEEGTIGWVDTVEQFYASWKGTLEDANKRRKELKQSLQEESSIVCEECGRNMVIKWGRNGRFLACPGYPECKNTKPLGDEQDQPATDETCDQCGFPMQVKTGRYGRFLACSAYPACKSVKPLFLGIPCPEADCSGQLVEKQSRKGKVFYGCDQYDKCKFASWDKPIQQACPHCQAPLLFERDRRGGSSALNCKVCNTQIDNTQAT